MRLRSRRTLNQRVVDSSPTPPTKLNQRVSTEILITKIVLLHGSLNARP